MAFTPPQIDPPPFNDPMVESDGKMTSEFFNWFMIILLPALAQTPSLSGAAGAPPVELTNQSDAISATSMALGSVNSGYYRVTAFLRVTTPDGVSSSVAVVIGFTSDGVACTVTGTALTADAINTPGSSTFLIKVDAPGPITYATTYASNTANKMNYRLTVLAERV